MVEILAEVDRGDDARRPGASARAMTAVCREPLARSRSSQIDRPSAEKLASTRRAGASSPEYHAVAVAASPHTHTVPPGRGGSVQDVSDPQSTRLAPPAAT